MLSNYLKIALRTLARRKGYAFINISGLAIGISCCLMIFMYVHDEYSYDTFHENGDRVYRVYRQQTNSGSGTSTFANSNYALAPLLEENYQQIEKATRISRRSRTQIEFEDKRFTEPNFYFAEASFFDLFDVEFLAGDPETALSGPGMVLVTPETARKYFGSANPVGKTLTIRDEYPLVVTGIIRKFPGNAHFNYDMIASMETTRQWFGESMFEHWGNLWIHTYVLLSEGSDAASLEEQFPDFVKAFAPPGAQQFNLELHLQKLTDIHLHSNFTSELEPGGNALLVVVFVIVAIIILAIASFNFINLSTARSAWRAKEVGIRKVAGAFRSSLIKQFIGESLLITLIAIGVSLILIEVSLPYFNAFTGKELALGFNSGAIIWGALFLILLVVGIASGSYPAFFLSSFQPVTVLKGRGSTGDHKKASLLRKGLVVFQFGISTALIIGTIIIYQQLDFVKNSDLGFDKEQVLVTRIPRAMDHDKAALVKQRFSANSNVLSASIASDDFPSSLNSWRVRKPGSAPSDVELIDVLAVDHDYLKTLDIKLKDGRDFSKDLATDTTRAVIINEAAAAHFGYPSAVGEELLFESSGRTTMTIIGVVEDFHYSSLHEEIAPVTLHLYPQWSNLLFLKISSNDLSGALAYMESEWAGISPEQPFDYYFMDESFDLAYRSEEKLGQLVSFFSFLAIFIASLGLFGLASFTAEQRTREIGIRKVLGASVASILKLLSKDYALLIIVSFSISIPVSLLVMNYWLDNFAYSVGLNPVIFIVAALAILTITIFTVGYQSAKTAFMNPVDSLKTE